MYIDVSINLPWFDLKMSYWYIIRYTGNFHNSSHLTEGVLNYKLLPKWSHYCWQYNLIFFNLTLSKCSYLCHATIKINFQSFKQLSIRFDLETATSKMFDENHFFMLFSCSYMYYFLTGILSKLLNHTKPLIKGDYSFVDI